MPEVDGILKRLATEGYRLTGPRRFVLEEITRRAAPFTATELLESVERSMPTVGRATVFRTLDVLTRLGIVQRIHEGAEGGRCHAYMACDAEHHHHLICNNCGTVRDFHEDEALEGLALELERRTAFKVEGHRLEFTGLCPECQTGISV